MTKFTKYVSVALLITLLVTPAFGVPSSRYATKSGNSMDRLADNYCDYVHKIVDIAIPIIEKTRVSSPKTAERIQFIYSSYLRRWHTYTANLINRVAGLSDNHLTRIGAPAALNTRVTDAQTNALAKIDNCLTMALDLMEETRNPSGEIRVYTEDSYNNKPFEVFSGNSQLQGDFPLKDSREVWIIENDGNGDLTIASVELANQIADNDAVVDFDPTSPIQADTTDLVLAPGETATIILKYTASFSGTLVFDLTIDSDDPDDDEDPFVLTQGTTFN